LARAGVCWLDAGALRDRHAGRLVALSGSVVRTGAPRLREAARGWECTRCSHAFALPLDAELGAPAPLPPACPARAPPCAGVRFRTAGGAAAGVAPPPAMCVDVCELLLAPSRDATRARGGGGSASASGGGGVVCVLEADLAAGAALGDEVVVAGVVRRRWRAAPRAGARATMELVLHAHALGARRAPTHAGGSVTLCRPLSVAREAPSLLREWCPFWDAHAARPLAGRDALAAALCPQLHGLARVKLALLLALAGGVPGAGAGGAAVRGEAHVLLVGDPGTGKSVLLRAAARLARRAVVATGGGVTSAGLTAAAVRDGGGWALEAGALVRAHRGVAVVDELEALPAAQRDALHEALEAQRCTVAKAGVHARLPCAATLLAACNPRTTRGAQHAPAGAAASAALEAATSLAAPLLSRFDIIMWLRDAPQGGRGAAADAARAAAVLGAGGAKHAAVSAPTTHSPDGAAAWTPAALARYLAAVRDALAPPLTAEAEVRLCLGARHACGAVWRVWRVCRVCNALSLTPRPPPALRPAQRLVGAYYQMQRRAAGRAAARTTPRLLESAVRLTQAHARLMMRGTAGAQDALQAILLLRAADAALGAPPACGPAPPSLSDDFVSDPDGAAAAEGAALCAALDDALGRGWRGEQAQQAPLPLPLPLPLPAQQHGSFEAADAGEEEEEEEGAQHAVPPAVAPPAKRAASPGGAPAASAHSNSDSWGAWEAWGAPQADDGGIDQPVVAEQQHASKRQQLR
jgi:DNA helicase MCM9